MCGIGGIVDFNKGVDPAILESMAGVLRARGPDAQGTLNVGACGFAHTRLSIIDIAGSAQPMSVSDTGMSIVYNGEIYNYETLRHELIAAGERFQSDGDTEVVLRLIGRAWREKLHKLDGMFAFAVWDPRRDRLLIARDGIGEKPLYYATPESGTLVFGSELKAVLRHPRVSREMSHDALRQALRFRAVYGEGTLHAGVRQLEPGCFLEFDRSGLVVGRFYDLIDEAARTQELLAGVPPEALVARGRELFLGSVKERLIADVPVGAFLSGGLDSSLIVAAMRHLQPSEAEIRSFSVGFSDDPHSELPFAQLVADAVGTRHTAISVGPDAYQRRMAELSACRDGPVSQPADVAIAEMSAVAREHVKVVLSGEGADEVFGGYPKYGFANAPWIVRKTIAAVGPERAAKLAGIVGLDQRRALVAARALGAPTEAQRLVQWFSYFDRPQLAQLLPGLGWARADWEATMAAHVHALERLQSATGLLRMQATDCLTWLPGNMLERGDRMTMSEGLEVRPPFLDKELCAFGLALPDHLKVREGAGKWIVRQWASELIPQDILARRKWGFRTPLKNWFSGPLRAFLLDYLTCSSGLVGSYGDPKAVSALVGAHTAGRIDASEMLWSLLAAEVWYQDVCKPRLQESAWGA